MAPRKNYKKKSVAKKPYKKKTYTYNKKYDVPRNSVALGKGFPKMIKMTHRWVENSILACTSGIVGKVFFSCNGMYDPNVSIGSTHQPMFFDQMTALYNHYTVIGSKITVRMTPLNTSAVAGLVGIQINDDTTASTDVQTIAETTGSVYKVHAAGSNNSLVLKKNWSCIKNFGKNPLANDELKGTSAANPTEQQYYNVFLQAVDAVSSVSYYITVTVDYIAVWRELKDIAGS